MIRFQEVHELKSASEISPPAELQDEKGAFLNQQKEAAAFWNDVFSQRQDTYSPDTMDYEGLLCDIFGRDESEFTFDFEITGLSEIINKFKSDAWAAMPENERIDVIQEFLESLSNQLGLENAPALEFYEGDWSSYGAYSPVNQSISINIRYFDDPKELVNTLAHEVRHAYQHQRAEMLETREDWLYKFNFDNYVSPQELPNGAYLFFTDYQDQYVETEARAFAGLFDREMSE